MGSIIEEPSGDTFEKQKEEDAATIEGFLILSSLPSKSLLKKQFKEIFKDGRGYFPNKMDCLRRKFYLKILPKYTVSLGQIRFVPLEKIREFKVEIENLKQEFAQYELELTDFIVDGKKPRIKLSALAHFPDYTELKEYIKKRENPEEILPDILSRVSIDYIPWRSCPDFFETVDEKIGNEIERSRKRMIQHAIGDVNDKVKEVLGELIKTYSDTLTGKQIMAKNIEKINCSLDCIVDLAQSAGLGWAISDNIALCTTLSKALESGSDEQISDALGDASGVIHADDKLRALFEEIHGTGG